jgi:hypothetical protein
MTKIPTIKERGILLLYKSSVFKSALFYFNTNGVNLVNRWEDVLLSNTVYLQQRVDTVNTLINVYNPLTLNALTHNKVQIFVECFIDLIENC